MKNHTKKVFGFGATLTGLFAVWSFLVYTVDVKPCGVNGSNVGFASLNTWFHSLTGVDMTLYAVTDWLGLVPVAICSGFAVMGFIQLVKRKSLFKVDVDIILAGVYYFAVFACYFIFEMIPINYRPVLIDGFMEASYPSSTTLLVLAVMPTFVFLINRRLQKSLAKNFFAAAAIIFSGFMVIGRVLSGVHWVTDIIGSVILSAGLFEIYKSAVLFSNKN